MSNQGKNKARPGNRRRDLIQELENIFLAEGFQHLTVDILAAKLKCSKRSLYHIAPTKQEMFLRILEGFLDQIRRKGIRGALEHEEPAARLAAFMEPGFLESKRASRQWVEDIQSYAAASKMLELHQRERIQVLRDIVDDGIRRGTFRSINSSLVAATYLAGIGKIDDPRFLEEAGLGFGEAFEELYRLIAHGLVRDEPVAGKKGARRLPK